MSAIRNPRGERSSHRTRPYGHWHSEPLPMPPANNQILLRGLQSTPHRIKTSSSGLTGKRMHAVELDALLRGELQGAILNDVGGLPERLFPDSLFPTFKCDESLLANLTFQGKNLYDVNRKCWPGVEMTVPAGIERRTAGFFAQVCNSLFYKSTIDDVSSAL
jgi:hypothetical protein